MTSFQEMRSLVYAVKRVKLSPSRHAFSTYQRVALADVHHPSIINPMNATMDTPVPTPASESTPNPASESTPGLAEGASADPETIPLDPERPTFEVPLHMSHLNKEQWKTLKNMPVSRSLHALYMRPLHRAAKYKIPVCDLQLRSYSVRNLEFFADFAMRAAYFLNMPAKGPIPLPRLTESWVVPRANFVFKKSQENFRRITLRRLIQIQDADPETVQIWLGYLERRQFHGVGMKANLFEWEGLEVGKKMDQRGAAIDRQMDEAWSNFGTRADAGTPEKLQKLLSDEVFARAPREMEALIREPIEIQRKK